MKSVLNYTARVLALLWAGIWACFLIAEAMRLRAAGRGYLPWVGMGVLFVIVAFVPWRWQRMGGYLLLALGLVLGIDYELFAPPHLSAAMQALIVLTLSVPPVISGTLFLLRWRPAPQKTTRRAEVRPARRS